MAMQLNPSEISELIRARIKDFDVGAEARTEGSVVSLTDGIARIHGLADAMQGEICLLYTSPSPRDGLLSRMPSSA